MPGQADIRIDRRLIGVQYRGFSHRGKQRLGRNELVVFLQNAEQCGSKYRMATAARIRYRLEPARGRRGARALADNTLESGAAIFPGLNIDWRRAGEGAGIA